MLTSQADFSSRRIKTIINEVKAACISKNTKVADIDGTPASLDWTQYDEWVANSYSAAYLGNMLTEIKANIMLMIGVYRTALSNDNFALSRLLASGNASFMANPTDFHNLGNILIELQESVSWPDLDVIKTHQDQTYTHSSGSLTSGNAKVQLDISENTLCGDISGLDIDKESPCPGYVCKYASWEVLNLIGYYWKWKYPPWSAGKGWYYGASYYTNCPIVPSNPTVSQTEGTSSYSLISLGSQTLVGAHQFGPKYLWVFIKWTVNWSYKGTAHSFYFRGIHYNTVTWE
jgi:hypothetical protein